MKKLIDNHENYLDIYNEWKEIKISNEQWHQFVKLASYFDEIQIMMNRVYTTLYHKDGLFNISNYFEVKFIENTHIIHERCLEMTNLNYYVKNITKYCHQLKIILILNRI